MTSGKLDDTYDRRVLQFDWTAFFEHQHGGAILEALRQEWIKAFDVTLIDSRTGITDSGGVCTIQMPDILVPVFTPNRQSLDGAKKIAIRAQSARQHLAYDRTRLLVFPLPSRFDARTEYREAQNWLRVFGEEMQSFYADWLPKDVTAFQMLERTKLPYVPFFSFGEKLPVLTEGTSDPESLGFAYETAATLIATDFRDAQTLLLSPATSSQLNPALPLPQWVQRVEQAIDLTGFGGKPSFALSVVPTRGLDLPQILDSHHQLVQLVAHPPRLRSSGFDISPDPAAKLAAHGRVRRSIVPGYKLLELWRDGCIIFVADGAEFLCRDIDDSRKTPMKINTLVLAESTFLFCELAKKVFLEAMRAPRRVTFLIEFRNLKVNGKNPALIPSEVIGLPWPGTEVHEAEYGSERFTIEADMATDPDITAFELVSEIYSWFNVERENVPYATEKNGIRRIDVDRIRSLKG